MKMWDLTESVGLTNLKASPLEDVDLTESAGSSFVSEPSDCVPAYR
jgi:hypothetical protein